MNAWPRQTLPYSALYLYIRIAQEVPGFRFVDTKSSKQNTTHPYPQNPSSNLETDERDLEPAESRGRDSSEQKVKNGSNKSAIGEGSDPSEGRPKLQYEK